MKIAGEATYIDAKSKRHSIEGVGSLPDDINLQNLNVSGSIEFDEISCDKIKIEGSGEGKSLTAKNLSVDGSLEVDEVKVEALLKISGSINIDNLTADEILMESRGGRIGAIKCVSVKIFHGEDHDVSGSIFSGIFGHKFSQYKISPRVQIKTIDADKVNLQNCEVDVIRCNSAKISSNCVIEKLLVTGECEVADDAKVGETIRNKPAK